MILALFLNSVHHQVNILIHYHDLILNQYNLLKQVQTIDENLRTTNIIIFIQYTYLLIEQRKKNH